MIGTMKAAILTGQETIEVCEVPIPDIGPEDILFKVHYASICGTDLPAYRDLHYVTKMPVILGHEFTGTVVEVGEKVEGIRPDTRFMGTNFEWCGECEDCRAGNVLACKTVIDRGLGLGRDGVFAEYSVLHKAKLGLSVFPLPECIDDLHGAVCEPMAVGVTAVKNAIHPQDGERVVIYGAGIIGQSFVQAMKAACKCEIAVVDVSDLRLELAKQSGADIVINPAKGRSAFSVLAEHWGYGAFSYHKADTRQSGNATLAIECTANMDCVSEAFEIVTMMGKVCLAAGYGDSDIAQIRPMNMMLKMAQVFPGWGGDFQASIDYMTDGHYRTDHMITHVYTLDQIQEAFHMAMNAQECCKVCIKIDPEAGDYPGENRKLMYM